jgi:hypothetical protein
MAMKSERETKRDKEILTHIKYIKETVDINKRHLETINGRLRSAENNITGIKAVGSTVALILSLVVGIFKYSK